MIIYKKEISEKIIAYIIQTIKEKKELSTYSESSIRNHILFELKRNKPIREYLSSISLPKEIPKKKKEFVQLIKSIREVSRRVYGSYITKHYDKRFELLQKNDFDSLLDVHISTKERKEFYEEIYFELKARTCIPKSVLDLACGLNPAAKGFIINSPIQYFASDISEDDVDFLNQLLKNKQYQKESKAFKCDLANKDQHNQLKEYKTDWCLLFKALDPVEEIAQNITYDLLDAIKSKWIIVSFPTITVSRKPMRNKRRSWFEKALKRKELDYTDFEINNELFYVIKNH